MTRPRFLKSEHSQAWFLPGNSRLTGLWIQLLRSEALGGKWWWRDIFRVLKKKNQPSTNWEDQPWLLEWIGVPSDRLRYFPPKNVSFPFFLLNWAKTGNQKVSCLCAPGAGERVEATGFHFTCFDLLDLTYAGPEKAPRHWSCQRWQIPFQGNNCFQ